MSGECESFSVSKTLNYTLKAIVGLAVWLVGIIKNLYKLCCLYSCCCSCCYCCLLWKHQHLSIQGIQCMQASNLKNFCALIMPAYHDVCPSNLSVLDFCLLFYVYCCYCSCCCCCSCFCFCCCFLMHKYHIHAHHLQRFAVICELPEKPIMCTRLKQNDFFSF